MQRPQILGTIIVLVFTQFEYNIQAAGFGGGKSSTNEKDLKEIEKKLQDGIGSMKGAWDKILTMKTEQHAFEIDLRTMLEKNPDASTPTKKMLEDQKPMQDELLKLQLIVKECQCKFETWIIDVQEFQKAPTEMATYEALKPFIRALDAATDQLKTIPQKLTDHAKRYKEFGQSMLDSENIDTSVNKRLCSLGAALEDSGYQVSDIGDPIALISDRIQYIWQRTNAKDKDSTLSKTTMILTPKGNAIVSDGDLQATKGGELKKICKKIAEKAKSQPPAAAVDAGASDSAACKEELDQILKVLEEISVKDSDLEKLKENLETIVTLETEFESLVEGIPNSGIISKQVGKLAKGLAQIQEDIASQKTKVQVEKPCEGKIIEEFGTKIHGLFTTLLGGTGKFEQVGASLVSNGKLLVEQTKFGEDVKGKYDIVGEKVSSAGSLVVEGGILSKIEDIGKRFENIGKSLGGDSGNTLIAIGSIVKGGVEPLKLNGQKIVEYGKEIGALEVTVEKATTEGATAEESKDEEKISAEKIETETEKTENAENLETTAKPPVKEKGTEKAKDLGSKIGLGGGGDKKKGGKKGLLG